MNINGTIKNVNTLCIKLDSSNFACKRIFSLDKPYSDSTIDDLVAAEISFKDSIELDEFINMLITFRDHARRDFGYWEVQ